MSADIRQMPAAIRQMTKRDGAFSEHKVSFICEMDEEIKADKRSAAWLRRRKEILEEKESLVVIRQAFSHFKDIPVQTGD